MYVAPEALKEYIKKLLQKSLVNENSSTIHQIFIKLVEFVQNSVPPDEMGSINTKRCNAELSCITPIVIKRMIEDTTLIPKLLNGTVTILMIARLASNLKRKNEKVFSDIMSQHKRAKEDWESAVTNPADLDDYATAASNMGCKEWVKAGINWMEETIISYYTHDGQKKAFAKGVKASYRSTHDGATIPADDLNSALASFQPQPITPQHKIRILDVGSCYNPFVSCASRDIFDVTAMDLCPNPDAPSVLTGDFLAVTVGNSRVVERNHLLQLPCCYYDAITLSLVLSYLPTSAKRIEMLVKAHVLLRPPSPAHAGGILLIAEKVSIFNRAHVQCPYREAWIRSICDMGFQLLCYRENVMRDRRMHWLAFRRNCIDDCNLSNIVDKDCLVIKQEMAENVGDS